MGSLGSGPSKEEAMELLKQRMAKIVTPESVQKALSFKPRPDDLFLVTTPQSGTTWSQQIIHGLRTGGDMDFEEITTVFPHIEIAHDMGYGELDKPQVAQPRCFKSHFNYDKVPKGARYIFVVRDPRDVAPSFYNFLGDWTFAKADLPVDDFVMEFFVEQQKLMQQYWAILNSWYPHRADPDVLWLHYEDLQEDLPGAVDLIADFIGVGDPERRAVALRQASGDFMKAHASRFDEHPLKLRRNGAIGLPPSAGTGAGASTKVRVGKVEKERLADATIAAIKAKWSAEVTPVTGYDSYTTLRAGINKELGRQWES